MLEWSDSRVVRDRIILKSCAGHELADAMEAAKYSLFAFFYSYLIASHKCSV